jgi:AraC family transcriptional regulator
MELAYLSSCLSGHDQRYPGWPSLRLNIPAEVLEQSGYSGTRGTLDKTFSDGAYRWLNVPRWYLWEGGFLLIGRAEGFVPLHSHHAIQIVIALDGNIAIGGDGNDWREAQGIIVQADVPHSFNCNGAMGAMLFVDPESREGAWLRTALSQEISLVPEARLASSVSALQMFLEHPLGSLEIGALIRHCVHALSPGAPPVHRFDPRVATVLNSIRARDDLRISLETASEMAFLSPSRFAHLFKGQVGLPYSRYMLWRKLTRAMVAISLERTIAAAAHAADFADAAHLTRTFYQMVGMAPSALMRGEFAEIPSPFHLPD